LGLLSYKKGIFTPHNPFKIPPFKQYMPGITAEDLMNMLDRDDNVSKLHVFSTSMFFTLFNFLGAG
tara:strand:- start:77 stop:274 length:198 start_codon:yes stop_codon:yes gene_type:complete